MSMNVFALMFDEPPAGVIDQMTLDYSAGSAFRQLVSATDVDAFMITPDDQYTLYQVGRGHGRHFAGRRDAIHFLEHTAGHLRETGEVKQLAEAARNDLYRDIAGNAPWRERLMAHASLAQQYAWHLHDETINQHGGER